MRTLLIILLGTVLFSCINSPEAAKQTENQNTIEETVQKEFSVMGTTWKTENGGIIIFSEDEGKFLFGNEEMDEYQEGEYSKFGDKYSLKPIGGEFNMLIFLGNFQSNPFIFTIDNTNPPSFSFIKMKNEKVGTEFKEVEKTITFTLHK